MPSDALHYSFLARELNDVLKDGRIEKITMPEKDEIIITVRSRGQNRNLLISASPSCPRFHLTAFAKENPAAAPTFLMHLRKHIGGAKILGVESRPFERIIDIKLLTRNELSVEDNKTLTAEIMGKYSNIILVGSDGKISDSIRRVNLDTSSKRQVLPGLTYLPAPAQDRIDPVDPAAVSAVLAAFGGGDLNAYLLKHLRGLAPASITEAVFVALKDLRPPPLDQVSAQRVTSALKRLYDVNSVAPCVRYVDGRAADFYIRPYASLSGEYKFFGNLSEAMDEYFYARDKVNRFNERSRHLSATVKNAIARTEKKLGAFRQKQEECADCETDKLMGELLTANLYRIKTGMKSAELENYYDEGRKITVPLDTAKSPQANAQKYYKQYTKKKKTLEQLKTQIEAAENSLDYYETLLLSFSLCCELAEIDDLCAEMEQAGLLKPSKTASKKKRSRPSSPLIFETDGFTIKIGKNNVQNDELTRQARPDDVWLHTQKIHGSHVVIVSGGKKVPDAVILRAASAAAYYSKAAKSENVPVDYTLVKYVSKPKGAPAGKVIYTHQNTVYVTPLPVS